MKKNIEKVFYIIANLFIIFAVIVFTVKNFDVSVSYFCLIMQKTYVAKLAVLSTLFFASGYFAGYCLCMLKKIRQDELCNAYQKRHENISVEKDENTAKIAALEAKIQTLEAALDSALNNK